MEDLADLIAKIRLDQSEIVVTTDILRDLLQFLEDQRQERIALDAFLQFVLDRNLTSVATPPQGSSPSRDDSGIESPQFNFRTPKKPFTPFQTTKPSSEETVPEEAPPNPFSLNPGDELPDLSIKQPDVVPQPTIPLRRQSSPSSSSGSSNAKPSASASASSSQTAWFWGSGDQTAGSHQSTESSSTTDAFSSWQEFKFELGTGKFLDKKAKPAPAARSLNPTARAGKHSKQSSPTRDSTTVPQETAQSTFSSSLNNNEEPSAANPSHAEVAPEVVTVEDEDESEMSVDFDFRSPFSFQPDHSHHQKENAQQQNNVQPDPPIDPLNKPVDKQTSGATVAETAAQPQSEPVFPSFSSFVFPPQSSTPSTAAPFEETLAAQFSSGVQIGGEEKTAGLSFNVGAGTSTKAAQKLQKNKRKPASSARPPSAAGSHSSKTAETGGTTASQAASPVFVFPSMGTTSSSSSAPPPADAPPAWWTASTNTAPDATATQNGDAPTTMPVEEEEGGGGERSDGRADTASSPGKNREAGAQNAFPSASSHVPAELQERLDFFSKQGKEAYSHGHYESALDAYTTCLQLAPPDWIGRATITGNRAAVFFMMERFIECCDDCDDALRLDPTLLKLHIRKGKALLKLGHFNPADAAFSRLLAVSMDDFLGIVIDAVYLQSLNETLTSTKMEANAGLREIVRLKEIVQKLISAESRKDYHDTLAQADELLGRSPFHRSAAEAKARALVELGKFDASKLFLEENTRRCPPSLRSLQSHRLAPAHCPSAADLVWKESTSSSSSAGEGNITVDLVAVQQMMLCMGSSFAVIYLSALKNGACSKYSVGDVMQAVYTLLERLQTQLSSTESTESWAFVNTELHRLRKLISLKRTADTQFKEKHFRAAMQSYSQALQVDATAKRWNAILFCNRAAAHMALGNFAEAVADCHSAVQLAADYSKAYLRRARAFRAMNKYHEAVRDFRRYLCTDPAPSDFREVQKELEQFIESKNQQQQQQQQAREQQSRNNGPSGRPSSNTYSNTYTTGSSRSSGAHSSTRSSFDFDDFAQTAGQGRQSRPQQQQPRTRYAQQQQQQQQQQQRKSRDWTHYGFDVFDDDEDDDEDELPSYTRRPGSSRPTSSSSYQHGRGSGSASNPSSQRPPSGNANSSGTTSGGGNTTLFSLQEKDHYTVLGVDTAASDREIKLAYRKLALQFHPDKNKEDGAEERFKMISMAYTVLSDKASRREYDLSRPLPRTYSSSSGRYW